MLGTRQSRYPQRVICCAIPSAARSILPLRVHFVPPLPFYSAPIHRDYQTKNKRGYQIDGAGSDEYCYVQ